nr:PLP-dependent aminotransferase family protein [Clostridium paraputrificum]
MNLYIKIAKDIKKLIIENKVPSGGKLPSINSLCKKYNCSKGTIIKAYDSLCKEHLVYSFPQSGFYVVDSMIREGDENSSIYDLSSGNPTINSIPIQEIKHCLNTAIELYSNSSLELSLAGSPSLGKILPDHLAKQHVYCDTKNIYLAQGILQVLTVLSQMPFPNGNDTILIEEPSYSFFVRYLKFENKKVKTIKRDEDGIDLNELEQIFKNDKIKFFYTAPRNHNPLGTHYSNKHVQAIINLAHKYNVFIVEDDNFADSSNLSRYCPIYYYSNFKNCIYLKSYTKCIPYIRIGVAIIPDELVDAYNEGISYSYYYSYYMPSLVSQATLESYIKSSLFDKHTLAISTTVNNKLKLIRKITKKWDWKLIKLIGASSGYYSTLKLSPKINCNKLIENLRNRNVHIKSNIESFYDSNNFDNSIRISVARINKTRLETALNIIYEEVLNITKQYHS